MKKKLLTTKRYTIFPFDLKTFKKIVAAVFKFPDHWMVKSTGQHRFLSLKFTFIILCGLWVTRSIPLYSQDPVFTQFYHSPLQINPAFAGNTYAPKIHLNSRVQWPEIPFAYTTFGLSYDQFFYKRNIGIGAFIKQDIAGAGILNTLRIEGITAYRIRVSDGHYVKLGLSLALIQKRLNWDKLIFSDQIDAVKGYIKELDSSENRPEQLTVFSPDLTVGLMYYSEQFFIGYAMQHTNNPAISFFNDPDGSSTGWPIRHNLILGGQINFSNKNFLSPAVLFSSQAKINQLNFQLIGNIGTVYAGIGYRYWFENPDAVLTTIGVQYEMFKIGYSYDMTVSGLSPGTGGSHEVSFIINFDKSSLFKVPFRYSDCFEAFR